jgi:hypothetical protein
MILASTSPLNILEHGIVECPLISLDTGLTNAWKEITSNGSRTSRSCSVTSSCILFVFPWRACQWQSLRFNLAFWQAWGISCCLLRPVFDGSSPSSCCKFLLSSDSLFLGSDFLLGTFWSLSQTWQPDPRFYQICAPKFWTVTIYVMQNAVTGWGTAWE